MQSSKVILVAGASSGLGRATAQALCESGHIVYAGARSFKSEATEQCDGFHGVLHRVNLDVTSEASIGSLVSEIVRREGRIDVLINCAAIIILGAVEDLSMDEFQLVIDTNFIGAVRACRHVLPHMRQRSSGLIINFSSGAGLIGVPFQSAYCSSKFAIEGFSETLRWEVKNRGIDVVIVEPGDNNAGSEKYRLHARRAGGQSAYEEDFGTVTAKIASDEANGAGPQRVARTVCRIVKSHKPHIRYGVFRLVENLIPLKSILPTWIVEAIFFGYYGLKPKKK